MKQKGSVIAGLVMTIGMLALALLCSGCAGRVYVGWEPTDTVTETHTMSMSKTIWCRLFVCGEDKKDA